MKKSLEERENLSFIFAKLVTIEKFAGSTEGKSGLRLQKTRR